MILNILRYGSLTVQIKESQYQGPANKKVIKHNIMRKISTPCHHYTKLAFL
ncbi:hypothetical protein X975_02746, partial [Stegodyphus mimosarum]